MSSIDGLFSCCKSRPYLGPPSDFSRSNPVSAAYQAAQDEKKVQNSTAQSHTVTPLSETNASPTLINGTNNYLLASLR